MPSPRPSLSDIVHTFTGSLTGDGEVGLRVAGFIPHSHPLRRSVSEAYSAGYFNSLTHPSSPTSQSIPTHPPPSYYDIQDRPSLPPSRFPILPREEEGRERLPEYYCSVHREGVFQLKMELSSPFDRAQDRSWRKEYVVLHGTLLKLHKPKRIPFFASADVRSTQGEDGCTTPAGWMPGELLRRYTLQGAEVGIAGDYKKRHYVIRIRAETEQFLLSSKRVEEFMSWLEALSAAVDLSPSLEERSLPRYQTIPRRRRRRGGAQVMREQERIIRTQFPHLIEGGDDDLLRRESSRSAGNDVEVERQTRGRRAAAAAAADRGDIDLVMTSPLIRTVSLQESITEQDLLDLTAELEVSEPAPEPSSSSHVISSSSASSASTASSASSAISQPVASPHHPPEEKWRPPTLITPEANMRYARRCMAILCGDAPRQSDFIVKDGQRYRLMWESKLMIPEVIKTHSMNEQQLDKFPNGVKSSIFNLKTVVLPSYDEIVAGPARNETRNLQVSTSGRDSEAGVWGTYEDLPRDALGRERRSMIGLAL